MAATTYRRLILIVLGMLVSSTLLAADAAPASPWWKKEWAVRKKVTINPAAVGISEAIGSPAVLLRLSDNNFNFGAVKEDGSDIRAVTEDGKTVLPCEVEKIDTLFNQAFVWVKAPEIKPGTPATFWLYYGNPEAEAPKAEETKGVFDADTVLVYHLSGKGAPPVDATGNNNAAQTAGSALDGGLIGGDVVFAGSTVIKLPDAPALAWNDGALVTWSAWIKANTLGSNVVLFSRREGGNAFLIGLDNGVPFVEVTTGGAAQRSPAADPLATGAWRHLAVTISGGQITLYLDGKSYATLAAALPAMKSAPNLGGDVAEGATEVTAGFAGEIDEVHLSKVARPAGALLFAAINQGTSDQAEKLVAAGADEGSAHGGEDELSKHLSLIKDISKDLTVDGWVVIFLCTLLALTGGLVSLMKLLYLGKISKATNTFLKQWEHLAADLSVLDHSDEGSVKSMGGKASSKAQRAMRPSPLYHLYQLGFAEIQHRVVNARDEFRGLSGRSMEAIKSTLDGGLVREVQRLNSQLVFLTIGIAGGPYLGLLGTVIGVMITFAVIAKSGAVEVNSIAPGIAGALLATVAGLAVAIPCLFAYSYISTRIKDVVSDMQVFIDEFVARIAETFPEAD